MKTTALSQCRVDKTLSVHKVMDVRERCEAAEAFEYTREAPAPAHDRVAVK